MRESVKQIHIVSHFDDDWVAAQKGRYLDHRYFNLLIGDEPVDVFKPDGSPLLLFRPKVLPLSICERAMPHFRHAADRYSHHRQMRGGIVGYYDKPDCRVTAFTEQQLSTWGPCLPLVRAVNNVFRRELPSRYIVQRKLALKTDPQWVIGNTAFTTVTVNLWNEWDDRARTRVHQDAGDLPEGFGVITVLRRGNFDGGYLVFPKYRLAVDLRTTDVLLCDVHEFHGNASIEGEPGWERIACIFYYRTAMADCV